MTELIDPIVSRQFDRLPPHSADAEAALLASMALAVDRSVVAQVRGMIDREAFFQSDHQVIYDVLVDLHTARKGITALIVREELARRGQLEEVGGTAFVAQVLSTEYTSAHFARYAGIVREKWLLRQLITVCNDGLRAAYAPLEGDESADDLFAELSRRAGKIAAGGKASQVYRLGHVAREVLTLSKSGEFVRRIRTGIEGLDRVIGGLRRGGKNLIGGKPGMGKSLLLKQVLRNIAADGVPVGLITVEEDRFKVAENALSAASGIPNNRIAFGNLSPEEYAAAEATLPAIDGLPFFIVDSARKLSRIVAMANVLATQHKCEVIGVDHVHIVGTESPDENRERQISEISAGLKWAWKELGVAGVEAAQLNRKSGKERPALDSLRDSGSLEQDGDVILLLHREDYYRRLDCKPGQSAPEMDGVLEVIVAKNKDGATGLIPLQLDEATQTVTDPPAYDPFANPAPVVQLTFDPAEDL